MILTKIFLLVFTKNIVRRVQEVQVQMSLIQYCHKGMCEHSQAMLKLHTSSQLHLRLLHLSLKITEAKILGDVSKHPFHGYLHRPHCLVVGLHFTSEHSTPERGL